VNDRLLEVGRDLSAAVARAENASDAELARQLDRLARALGSVKREIEGLDTPADLGDESAALTRQIDSAADDLEAISRAAAEKDPEAAAEATVRLAATSQKVNSAQNELARATGADVGER
jgi:uncharacterized protein Yka (UPF0111/DUF47 family)